MNEIKKAFETMKKELKKETGIYGGFVMNAKQIENRTATYIVCNLIPYEKEIEDAKYWDGVVQGYKTWTDEAKARRHSENMARIATLEDMIAKYGTKMNEGKERITKILESKAFEKFSTTLGGVKTSTEIKTDYGVDFLYLRFRY